MDFIFEFQKATSRFELETDSLFMALEMCDMRHDDMIRRANYKIFCESGTYEDALYLYEEANAETSEQKEGIISRIINWIKEQLGKIKTFLFGNKKTEEAKKKLESPDAPDNKEVRAPELPGGPEEFMKDQEGWLDKVIKWAKGVPVVGDIIADKKKTVGAAVTFGVATTGKALVEYFLNERLYTHLCRKIDEANDALEAKIKKKETDEKDKNIATGCLKILRAMTSGISQLTGWALKTADTWAETKKENDATLQELTDKIAAIKRIPNSKRTQLDEENLKAYEAQVKKLTKTSKTIEKHVKEEEKTNAKIAKKEDKRAEKEDKAIEKENQKINKKYYDAGNEDVDIEEIDDRLQEITNELNYIYQTPKTKRTKEQKADIQSLKQEANALKQQKSKVQKKQTKGIEKNNKAAAKATDESWFDFDIDGEYMSEFDNDILDDQLDYILSEL